MARRDLRDRRPALAARANTASRTAGASAAFSGGENTHRVDGFADPGESSRMAYTTLLPAQRLDDGRPRFPLEVPDESAEAVEERHHAPVGVGEVRDPDDAALPAHERRDVRSCRHRRGGAHAVTAPKPSCPSETRLTPAPRFCDVKSSYVPAATISYSDAIA